MDPKLVYDVSMHRGDDTAYYLHKGFRVVGVEANPAMAVHLRDRFKSEIATGALQLLEVGVAEVEGELDFWVCDAVTEWSSFNEKKAGIGGKTARSRSARCPSPASSSSTACPSIARSTSRGTTTCASRT